MKYVLAKRYAGEKKERYFGGDTWTMEGDLQRAYVFNTRSEIDTALENHKRRWPDSENFGELRIYEAMIAPPVPPPLVTLGAHLEVVNR